MNTKIIKLDLNRILYDKIIAKQGDTKSRFLLFQLLDGSIAFNLTNRSVRAYMVKPDGKEIFNDLIINNYSLGYCTLELTNQVLAVPGTVKIELMVTEEDRKLTSSVFELEVIKSINSEKSIVSTNEFTALLNGLSSLSEYDNYKNEIAAARDGEVNLLTKVKKIDEQLDTIENNTELNKTDINVLNERVNNISSLNHGSTTGDLELIDGRLDCLGFSNTLIGENIRKFQKLFFSNDDLKISCGEWELGIISVSNGQTSETNKTKFARIKDFISVQVGCNITFKVVAGGSNVPKLTLYFYDSNKQFIKSMAVENKTISIEYPYIKVCYFYEGATVDIVLSDAQNTILTTPITFKSLSNRIPELINLINAVDKIPQVKGTLKANEKVINFNDYPIGYYFIDSNSSSANELVNAPNDATYGYYELIGIPFTTKFSIQFTICTNGEKKGYFFRTYNYSTGETQIKWTKIKSGIDVTNNKYFACGDSITWGHISGSGTTESPFVRATYPYPTIVANTLDLDLTYGAQTGCGWLQVSGNKTAKIIIDGTDFSQYHLSTWAFGTNDYANNQPLGDVNSETGGNTVCGIIKYCIEKAYRDNPNIILILITPLNSSHSGATGKEMLYENNYRYGTPNTQGYTLSDLCQKIVEICEMYNVPYIDHRKGSVVTLRNINNILIDKLHPTDRGYITLGQFLSAKIGGIFRPFHW